MEKTLTCIGCPMGCTITVTMEDGKVQNIEGNTCQVGYEYAAKEVIAPVRKVTTTVRVQNGNLPVLPVKTSDDIPKEKIFDVIDALQKVQIEAPFHVGEVVVDDICNTGVSVVATANVLRQ